MLKHLKILAITFVGFALHGDCLGAIVLESVEWTPPIATPPVASGSGTWLGGETVNLSTSAANNAGAVFSWNWNTMPFATGYTVTGTTNTGIAVGAAGSATSPQSVSFSSTVNSPYLYFNFIDPNTSFNFSPFTWTFIAGSQASRSGSSVISTGTNGPTDGFLIQVNETFGPGTPLAFNYVNGSVGTSSAGFTVGVPVPEPATCAMALAGLACGGYLVRRCQKRA